MDKEKRICFVSTGFYEEVTGGAEFQSYLIAKELKKRGYDLHYIYITDGSMVPNKLNLKLHTIRKREMMRKLIGKYFIFDIPKLFRILAQLDPDVIYQRIGCAYTGIAAYFAKRRGKKMIWHISHDSSVRPLGVGIKPSFPFEYIDKRCLEYGLRNCNVIVGQSERQNTLLQKNYGLKCSAIIPNVHPIPRRRILKRFPVRIVWIANFKKVKQPEEFIKLAKELKGIEATKFIMVGRCGHSKWHNEIRDAISSVENLEYKEELPLDEVNRILSESHIFVNTSKHEGFPNTFIQAWMRKVPVVSLNIDPDDILKNKGIGFHSGSFEQLIKDTKRLIENEELRETMGKKAQRYAFKNHSLANIEEIVELIIE